jgi:hypothetical protein
MKIPLAWAILLTLLPHLARAENPPAAKSPELAALEKKLLGPWRGAACAGDYTFNPDGTFVCHSFTPGQNTLTGTWSIRWDALPPTLVLTAKTSDFKTKDPTREEYDHLNKPLELKLVQLTTNGWTYRYPNDKFDWRSTRPETEEK